jgi:hypothetical protein
MREAAEYLRKHWNALRVYLDDALVPIDNNDVEQLMKQVAVGRKNWLFIGSVAAGDQARAAQRPARRDVSPGGAGRAVRWLDRLHCAGPRCLGSKSPGSDPPVSPGRTAGARDGEGSSPRGTARLTTGWRRRVIRRARGTRLRHGGWGESVRCGDRVGIRSRR